jgi:hypothetical protein
MITRVGDERLVVSSRRARQTFHRGNTRLYELVVAGELKPTSTVVRVRSQSLGPWLHRMSGRRHYGAGPWRRHSGTPLLCACARNRIYASGGCISDSGRPRSFPLERQ